MVSVEGDPESVDEPRRFGRYEIVARIGQGAMGEVYQARDTSLGRLVAIKTMSPAVLGDDEHIQRFTMEARSVARLNHPNVVTLLDFGEDAGRYFIAMEFVEGEDLASVLRRRGLGALEDQLQVIEQVLEGVAYAHAAGVTHRDLKPQNIHVRPDGRVKIMDFGLARMGDSAITRDGVVVGTPRYMSPEQVLGERATPASDVFALGALCYEVFSGRCAFDGDSTEGVLQAITASRRTPLKDCVPDLPAILATFVERALARDPAQRYRDAGDMRIALERCRRVLSGEIGESAAAASDNPLAESALASLLETDPVASKPKASVGEHTIEVAALRGPSATQGPSYQPSWRRSRSINKSAPLPDRSPHAHSSRPPRRALPLALGTMGLLAMVSLAGYFGWSRSNRDTAVQSRIDALTQGLVDTQLDLAHRAIEDKEYDPAIQRALAALRLDPTNGDALAIQDRALNAKREIETSTAKARSAVASGDFGAAAIAVESIMALDPRDPAVAELSAALNESFAKRANLAKENMEKARSLVAAKAQAAQEPAFLQANQIAARAERKLEDRQFTAAAQAFLQARDVYDRARRSIEGRERESLKSAALSASALPPSARGGPTTAAATPGPVTFETGSTHVWPARPPSAGRAATKLEFSGRFEFATSPTPPTADAPFRIQVFLKNDGERTVRIQSLGATVTRNNETSPAQLRLREDKLKEGQRTLVAEISDTWFSGTLAWELRVDGVSKSGERFSGSLTMRAP